MRRLMMVIVAAATPHHMHAQQTGAFDPFPGGTASAYQFNLARNFYPSSEAAARDRDNIIARARRLDSATRRIDGARSLYSALVVADSIWRDRGRQYAYLTLRPSIDTRDTESQRQLNEFAGVVEPFVDEVDRLLGNLSVAQFSAYVQTEPRLRRYEYTVVLTRRDREHQLDSAAERALGPDEARAGSWGPRLFQSTLAATNWGTVRAPEGDLDLRRNGNQIRNHTDRSVRERGFQLNLAGLMASVDTFAAIITRTASMRNDIARKRRWPDYPTQYYAANSLQPNQVRALLNALAARSEVNKRYERARIAQIKRDFGYDTVHVWDLWAPPPGAVAPRFTIGEATREILAAAAPIGPSYVRELRALLDPANGRLDLVARANRVDRAGFSTGSVGYPSLFFQGRFEGYTDDLVILSHEAGHAVQNMLMDNAGVLPRYAGGPSYFTESFAMLSELLLLEHLYRTAQDGNQRRYYLGRLLEDALDVYRNGYESLIELQIYDSVAVGRQLSAAGIERLTQSVGSRFSVWLGPGSERKDAWMQPLQFFTRPLYRSNYVIAKLLALKYYDLLRRDPVSFQTRYNNLLRNGYDAPPAELLQRFLGIDFSNANALIDGANRVIEVWLRDAESPPQGGDATVQIAGR